MIYRIFSTLILWGIAAGFLIWGGMNAGLGILVVLTLLAQFELQNILRKAGQIPSLLLTLGGGLFLMLGSYYIDPQWLASSELLAITIIITTIAMLPGLGQPSSFAARFLPTLFSIIYLPFMLHFYVRLGQLGPTEGSVGILLVVWLIAVTKFADAGGLFVGSCLGHHKLAPSISPGKTWEGALGAVFMAVAVGVLLLFLMPLPATFTLGKAIAMAVVVSIVAIISDLSESVIKRYAGVKDSGKVIPGIGGALDLCDSLVLTAPLGYILIKTFVYAGLPAT